MQHWPALLGITVAIGIGGRQEAEGVVARAADMLGMRRTTLVEKMKKYDMTARDM